MGDIYDLAVHLSAADKLSGVFRSLSSTIVPGLSRELDKLEASGERMSRRMKTAFAGIGGMVAGSGILEVMKKLEEHGEGLVHAKTLFAAALPLAERQKDLALITAQAYKEAGKNMQSTLEGNIELMHDLYTVTQDVGHASSLLSSANALKNAFASVKNQEGLGDLSSGSNIASAIRAFELTGRTTEERIAKVANSFVNTTIAMGSKAIAGGALMTQISNAGDARYGWSDDFLTKGLPAMIATGLQNRTGQALYQSFSNLYGGVSSSLLQGQNQEKYGLHSKADEVMIGGKFKGFKVGSLFEADLMRSNPIEWANDYRKKLAGMGINVDDLSTMQRVIGEIGRGNKGLKAFFDEVLLPQTNRSLNKEIGNINKIDPNARELLNDNDPGAWHRKVSAQFKNTLDAFGEQLVKPYIANVLKPLSETLRDVTQWAGKHPDDVRRIGLGLTALGGALVGGGGVALGLALGPTGWLVLGLGALGGAIGSMKKEDLDHLVNGLKHLDFGEIDKGLKGLPFDKFFKSYFENVANGVKSDYDKLIAEVSSWPARLGTAITTMGSSLVSAIGAELRGLAGRIGGFLGGLFNRTSFEGGGSFGGSGLIKASWGGAANDNGPSIPAGIVATNGGIINVNFGGGSGGFGGGFGAGFGGRHGGGGGGYNDTSGGGGLGNFSKDQMSRGMRAMSILTGKGWTPEAAASLVSQAMEESGIHPNPRGYADGGTAHGMHQWRFERFAALKAFAARAGKPWTDFDTQVAFADAEARARYHGNTWAQTHSLYQGGLFGKAYEGYGTNTFGDRYRNSQELLRNFKNKRSIVGPPPQQNKPAVHVHKHYIDGKQLEASVTSHQADRGQFPTQVGGIDSYGSFASPGTYLDDVA